MKNETLLLPPAERERLWQHIIEIIEQYTQHVEDLPVEALPTAEVVRALLRPFDFSTPYSPTEAVDFIADGLRTYQTHTSHPRYFGLFNPAVTTMGMAADMLVAAFNPQLASWNHSPLAAEIEQHLIRSFGARFGYAADTAGGTFTSGGAEANHTALYTALVAAFPQIVRQGIRTLSGQPVLYVSSESHHSFFKAAQACGLGRDAVRVVPVDDQLRLRTEALRAQIAQDRAQGLLPFMVVATAGTTSAGVIDPIDDMADLAAEENLWCHVDAAWGGAAVLVPELRPALNGIHRSDSITMDAHKWLSVPMGAGMLLTRHPDILRQAFQIQAAYMPENASDIVHPFEHSMQWSRRFIGLKLFLSLAVAGWAGYADVIRHQASLGDYLRDRLRSSRWTVVNETPLPVVCFVDASREEGQSETYLRTIEQRIVSSGAAWLSFTKVGHPPQPVLRACITNFRTTEADVDVLVKALHDASS